MNDPIHPARALAFDDLYEGLEEARARGFVSRRDDPSTGRTLYCYTNRCVYDGGWDDFSLMARGIILCPSERRLVATPFPKFFNAGERGRPIPDLPFEAFEKVDGSLAIIHYHDGRWRAATKGAFDSSQAQWVEARLENQDTSALAKGATYLAEAVYPENRIVVRYADAGLVMLAAYREDGSELPFRQLADVAGSLGWRCATRHSYASFAELAIEARSLPATSEGFVLRFTDGLRLKVKGEEYRRIHALISRCTPLAMWEAMVAGDDMEAIRRDLPEEFWGDFDAIVSILTSRMDELTAKIREAADKTTHLSDRDLGVSLAAYDPEVRPFLFPWRKSQGVVRGKLRQFLFRTLRPTGNELPGYVPSYAMGRVLDEAV